MVATISRLRARRDAHRHECDRCGRTVEVGELFYLVKEERRDSLHYCYQCPPGSDSPADDEEENQEEGLQSLEACPKCGAAEGENCRSSTGKRARRPHAERQVARQNA